MDFKAQDVLRIINDDPWDIVVYRTGETFEDPEETFSFVGTVHAQGSRGIPLVLTPTSTGESPIARFAWVVLAPQGTQAMNHLDELRSRQRSVPDIERVFVVSFNAQYAFKQEAVVEERQ